ncbi:hypothetical protein HB818_01295 [Listeria booriae]|uniref:hypothetical protein n=1 Tax=Listeria booriae TaxID=1552123 RepID=UPI001628FFBD|nr:hypothetical protein [Listeria booriae]MBC1284390.1 hypothetical protein [Listeria booriae]
MDDGPKISWINYFFQIVAIIIGILALNSDFGKKYFVHILVIVVFLLIIPYIIHFILVFIWRGRELKKLTNKYDQLLENRDGLKQMISKKDKDIEVLNNQMQLIALTNQLTINELTFKQIQIVEAKRKLLNTSQKGD